ncbi:hypothetical protein KBI52_10860 [Microvirga sp. HBU67558]|uniref:hypothetical protein n=1 Tax=Microvirga sp. HBU67558 TaxID=2824562 RepID=UPI001B372DA3|nr:hypothetical protein [Microvirga sp. HBU67558]MBQ0820705.1 hypothetical protein [Microvirga sp. HBU67558]
MAAIRKINWTSAMRDLRNDRTKPAVPSFLAARSLEIARLDRLAKEAAARPLAAGGAFDRSAIMGAAIAQARLQRAKGSKASWSDLMASALKSAWIAAKQQRALSAH